MYANIATGTFQEFASRRATPIVEMHCSEKAKNTRRLKQVAIEYAGLPSVPVEDCNVVTSDADPSSTSPSANTVPIVATKTSRAASDASSPIESFQSYPSGVKIGSTN